MTRRLRVLGIAVALSLAGGSIAPLPARAWGDSEFPVCTVSPSIQWMPAASGTRIVWVDQRNGGNDIYMYDLATGVERPICTAPGDQLWPEIDDDRIVWRDNRSGGWQIYLHYLSTGTAQPIASAPTSDVWYAEGPDIDGDLIVWADDRNDPGGNHDVFAYDLSTETLVQITDEAAEQGRQGPRVHNGRIVWCDFRNGPDGDIYMYDMSTAQETAVADGSISQGQPDIWGDIVVWTQAAGAYFDIWYRDLTTLTCAALCEADYIQDHPHVSGRWVVWSDDRNGGGDTTKDEVYAYDQVKQEERPLSASPHPYGNLGPTIADSGLVAWQDFRNGDRDAYTNSDIYAYVLPIFWDVLATHWAYDSVEACFNAGVVSGYSETHYRPTWPVSRDQMAVYISRALAGGEANVPEFTGTPTFSDVAEGFWALNHVEYAVEQGVVGGYADEKYHPDSQVDRGQMAVFIARARDWVQLDDDMTTAPELFPDVPAGFWAGTAIQACVDNAVAQGYGDGYYRPECVVSREQMAVYVARAFGLL